MSPRLILSLSLVALLAAAACSDEQNPGPVGQDGGLCGPANCIGCCSNNACVTTPSSAACGSGGQQCLTCKSGEDCLFGACTKGSACGPSNCTTGCCQAGMCVLGSSNTACGKGGANCTNCTQASQTCKNRVCSGGSQTCGPGKCAGCCKAGLCLTGNTHSVCGKGGTACVNCTASGKTCDSSTGACKGGGPTTCNSTNCSTGCCKNNQCHPGNTVSVCGKGGGACVDCSASGKKCDSSIGACKSSGPSCGPTSCGGCCKNNSCYSGNTATACGKGAATCVDCSASGQACDSSTGTCKSNPTTCSPSNCSGCCNGTKCETGYSVSACGKGGAACKTCKAWDTCLSSGCTLSAFSKFQITAISATIKQTKTWDWLAVGSYRNPDPFIGFKLGSSGCSGYYTTCSKTMANTYTPYWNHSLGTFSGTYLKYPCLTIRDEDSTTSGVACPTGYDIIGQCTLYITDADIAAGKKTLTSCSNPSDGLNYVSSVTIGIKHLP